MHFSELRYRSGRRERRQIIRIKVNCTILASGTFYYMDYFSAFLTRDRHRDISGNIVAIAHTTTSPRVGDGTDSPRARADIYRLERDTSAGAGYFVYSV